MRLVEISRGSWTATFSAEGHLISFGNPARRLVNAHNADTLCEMETIFPAAAWVVASGRILEQTSSSALFEGIVEGKCPVSLRFGYELTEPDSHGTALICRVRILPDHPLGTDLNLRWFWALPLGTDGSLFAPLFDGRGLRTSAPAGSRWTYLCAGSGGSGERLAMPIVDHSLPGEPMRCSCFTDPFFSTGMTIPGARAPGWFECRYLHQAGSGQFPERIFGFYLHDGTEEAALEGFFRHAMEDCGPGPSWLHSIAMVHYDFLSEKGDGWFRDIDRLVELVKSEDRGRIALTLHGWYDLLGRYCFDEEEGKLDAQWTSMPRGDRITMTLAEVHRRVQYGRQRGFRVLLYFADGMAIDSGAPNFSEKYIFREPDGTLRKHHWGGPDTLAQTYILDPLRPGVRHFFAGYLRALLEEFGDEIDGLNWDETFTTRLGDVSQGEYPGYTDRTFMLFCHDLRKQVKTYNPRLALLASDCTGLVLPQEDGSSWSAQPAQYAIVFDGTYQDSQCYPTAWQYGLFPNYRNVLWSCNWQPVKNFEWTVLGVKAFGAPAAISNGWGENRGISRYSEEETRRIMELFRFRMAQRGRVRWIECHEA